MCVVPNTAVYCSSLTSCFPGMLLTYFLYDFGIVPVAPIITGITFVFTFHMRCISIVRFIIIDIHTWRIGWSGSGFGPFTPEVLLICNNSVSPVTDSH